MIEDYYDYIIIGSGFGGAVSALRLSEKGYSVLVIEKGDWKKSEDFPKTNWNLKKWVWLPGLGFRGIFKLTFLKHLSILSGVGVGGGSLVYANTLPKPKSHFFNTGSWKNIFNWEKELEPYYNIAYKMLGAVTNPKLFDSDIYLNELSKNIKREHDFRPTKVAVYFGESEKEVADPYFNGEGINRTACNYCGRCMTGCPNNSKNTLDKNYLYFAQKKGTKILAKNYVLNVIPDNGEYIIEYRQTGKYFSKSKKVKSKGVVFAGGVLGSIPLLLKLKDTTMPKISKMIGKDIRSNNESLIFVTTTNKELDLSKGIAIGSILETGEHSHLEPVRYGSGSGFWRLFILPLITERNWFKRIFKLFFEILKSPIVWLKVITVRDFAKNTSVLLYMENLEGKLQVKNGFFGLKSSIQKGNSPSAFLPKAHDLARKFSTLVKGKPSAFMLEILAGIPSTAHVLGGAVIGENEKNGVINKDQEIFNYPNAYVCDGSAISANPGVNPALTITAMTERAMAQIGDKRK